jgi:hypothetical protein
MKKLENLKTDIEEKLKQLEDPLKIDYLNELITDVDKSVEPESSPMIKAIESIIQGGRSELQKQISKDEKKQQIIAAINNMQYIDNNLQQFVNYMKKLQEKRDELSNNDRVDINKFSNNLHDYLKRYFEHMYNIVIAMQTLKKEYERILILYKTMRKNPVKQHGNIIDDIVEKEDTIAWEKQWGYLNQDAPDKKKLSTHLNSIITNIENKKLKDQKAKPRGKSLNRNALDTVSITENEDTIIKNFIKKIMKSQLDDTLIDKIEKFNVVTVEDKNIATFIKKIYAYEKDGSYIRLAYSSNNEQDRKKRAEILDKKKLQFILQELVENDYKKHHLNIIKVEKNVYNKLQKKQLTEENAKIRRERDEANDRSVKLNRYWDILGSKLVEIDREQITEQRLNITDSIYGGSTTGGRNKIYKYSINARKVLAANSTTKKKNKSKSKRR